MDFKYKIGQAVRVRPDLKTNELYPMFGVGMNATMYYAVSDMVSMANEIVHISRYTSDGAYKIKENEHFCWTDRMFVESNALFACESML